MDRVDRVVTNLLHVLEQAAATTQLQLGPAVRFLPERQLDENAERHVVEMVDDLALGIARQRMTLQAGTSAWTAYASFLEGYLDNLYFRRASCRWLGPARSLSVS